MKRQIVEKRLEYKEVIKKIKFYDKLKIEHKLDYCDLMARMAGHAIKDSILLQNGLYFESMKKERWTDVLTYPYLLETLIGVFGTMNTRLLFSNVGRKEPVAYIKNVVKRRNSDEMTVNFSSCELFRPAFDYNIYIKGKKVKNPSYPFFYPGSKKDLKIQFKNPATNMDFVITGRHEL